MSVFGGGQAAQQWTDHQPVVPGIFADMETDEDLFGALTRGTDYDNIE